MRKTNLFYNQKRTFKFCSKNVQNIQKNFNDTDLKNLNKLIKSEDFSFQKFEKELINYNEEYKLYFDPTCKTEYPNAYNNFLETRIKSIDNKMDLFPLFLSKNTETFSKFYRKTNEKSELLDDMLIDLSIKSSNVDFILEINDQKENEYNFLGFKMYLPWIKNLFSIRTPEHMNEICINNTNAKVLEKYNTMKWNPSDTFYNNIVKNLDNEISKVILSKYNVKLNNDYNKMILENLIKNKNEEMIKFYINSPFFSFKKCGAEQFKYFLPKLGILCGFMSINLIFLGLSTGCLSLMYTGLLSIPCWILVEIFKKIIK